MAESVSRIKIKLVIENLGEVKGELIRYLAPRTIEALLRSMPIDGITALTEGMIYFGTPVRVGSEKPTKLAESGTIAYWPISSSACFFTSKTQPFSPVNVIGKVTDNLELLGRVGSGKRVRMEKI